MLMTKPRLFSSFVLLAVLLASCAPVALTELPAAPVVVEPSATPFAPVEPTLEVATEIVAAPTEVLAPTPLPVATSRGPDLHATDPTTISLASGGIQFVEFFRFT
jgi:hypothetical protein